MDKTLDVLAIVAHPDDAELAFGGTILKMKAEGYSVGIADMTAGELGSRGSAAIRATEAAAAADMFGLDARVNLGLADGFFEQDKDSLLTVIRAIRRFRPKLIITNATGDRHPDHGRANALIHRAAFLSGLLKIETEIEGKPQEKWRPQRVISSIQDNYMEPDFVVDITPYFDKKMEVIRCFASQFLAGEGPQTPISTQEFWDTLKARAKDFGRILQVQYAEGFISTTPLEAHTPMDFIH